MLADKNTLFERTRIAFTSGGLECAGYLYYPTNRGDKLPCVILANGFSNTMDWLLPQYAERFVAAGFAALIFDYRYFGESEGQPRQLVLTQRQREDIHAAIRFVRQQPEIDADRIALWGTSLGGGHVFYVAAEDPHIAAVVAQVPGFDLLSKDARATIEIPASFRLRLIIAILWDALHGFLGLEPYYIKIFDDTGDLAVFTDSALKPRFERLMSGSATWRNYFAPRFYLSAPRYQPGTAEKVNIPLLVSIADKDVYGNPDFQVKVAQQAPKSEIIHYAGDHFDFYHNLFEAVVTDEIDFLKRHLLTTSA